MNLYNIGDALVSKSSFESSLTDIGRKVGIIVSIVPSIKVKWAGIEAPEIVTAMQLLRYEVRKVKPNENRTPKNV